MAAERRGDISPGRGERSSAPSRSNNARNGACANADAELGVAASTATRDDDHDASAEFRILHNSNGDYEGEVKDGKPHGKGVFRYVNGDAYEGEVKDEKRHGTGVYRFANGNLYDGVWKDGLKHGRGVYKYANGHVYEGEFKEGKMHGRGVYSREHGEVEYDGEWKDDKCHGTGTYHYEDGSTYVGEFENDLEHGKGALRGADWSYRGDHQNGKRHGSGVYTYPSGDVYDGHWKDNKRHGSGIVRCANGNVYDGEWKDGVKNGTGTETSATGDRYVGEWKSDVPHGRGTQTWVSGKFYTGQWAEGKEHGKGTLTFSSGEVYDGQWVEGKRHGKFTWKGPKGGFCEQAWVNGRQTEGRRIRRKARGPSPAVDGATTNPEVVGGANSQAPTSSRPQVHACDQNDRGEEAERKATVGGATEEQQPEKEKRVYNQERMLRSTTSQQRRLQKDVAVKECEHCGADDGHYKLRICSGCNLALYCSMACQKAASRSHRRICDISSMLPSRDSDRLTLEFDREKTVDLDAQLRYGTKYMDNLKHLAINLQEKEGIVAFSAKHLSSLLSSKKGALGSFAWLSDRPGVVNDNVLKLHGLKQLQLQYLKFDDVQSVCDTIGQQRNSLMVLGLPYLDIAWQKAKTRRALAQAVSTCKHLVKLDLRGCVMPDSDLKVMFQDLPNLRILNMSRRYTGNRHQFTDNTCGLIARKCPGLQELCLLTHDQLSMKGIRKIFEGCVHLRSFYTSRKLSCEDIRGLLDIAPQLIVLATDDEMGVSNGELAQIIEATGGRTYLRFGPRPPFDDDNISAKAKERYERQQRVIRDALIRECDPEVANEWEEMFEG